MTYIPQHFRVSDEHTLQEFMRAYDFATVVSSSPDGLVTSHVLRPVGECGVYFRGPETDGSA